MKDTTFLALRDSLQSHRFLTGVDNCALEDTLREAYPDGVGFEYEFPDNVLNVDSNSLGSYRRVRLRRLFLNESAELNYSYEESEGPILFGGLIFDSSANVESILSDRELLRLMRNSNEEYSLLGRVREYDNDSGDAQYLIERPFLCIPGAEKSSAIERWEDSRLRVHKNYGLLGLLRKRLSFDEYMIEIGAKKE